MEPAARRLFGLPAAELTGIANDAAGVLGKGLRRAQQRIGDNQSWPGSFSLVGRYLLE